MGERAKQFLAEREDAFVLAIDLGTGGPKVGLVSVTGRTAWQDHIPVETRWYGNGGAGQDAGQWWDVICDAARRALSDGAVEPSQVVAVSCTGQWSSTVPVDAAGEPTGECILWHDTRGGAHARELFGGPVADYKPRPLATWVHRTGGAPSMSGADPIGHMLHIERDTPDVAKATRWYLEPVDYLSMRFTGEATASHGSQAGTWLTDNRHLDRMSYDRELVRLARIDGTKLPPLRPTGSVIGTVLPSVATKLGLPEDVKVVTGTPDLHSTAVGSGAVRDFEAHLAISTTSWIGAPVPFKKTDVLRQIASVPGLSTGSYLIANNHETGGACLDWVRDSFGRGDSYEELTALAATASPGSGSVVFTPWLNGERSPVSDRRARGGFHNMSLATTQADMVRSVLEGVAFNNRWLHDAVERFAKRPLDRIRFIGGGVESDLWCQIHADVMDRTVERVAQPRGAAMRGAALFAGLSLGLVHPDEVHELVAVDRVFQPDA
jgi:xylulokinase